LKIQMLDIQLEKKPQMFAGACRLVHWGPDIVHNDPIWVSGPDRNAP